MTLIALTLLGVAWGALAFGAVYPWAYVPLLGVVAGVGLVGIGYWTWHWTRTKARSRGPRLAGALPLTLAVLGLAVAVQLVPMRSTLLATVSPSTHQFLRAYDVGYLPTDPGSSDERPAHALSINPPATRRGLAFLGALSLFVLGLSALLSVSGARTVRALSGGVIALGLVLALVGIVQAPLYAGKVYGFWVPQQSGQVFGPFVNKNHFAGWMIMAVALGIGYCCGEFAQATRGLKPGWRPRLLWLSSRPAGTLLLAAFAVAVMSLSLVMTLSRSGIVALTLSLVLATSLAVMRLQTGRRRAAAVTFLVAVGIVAFGWAGVDAVTNRFATSQGSLGGRFAAWGDALGVTEDFALTGSGLNTYGTAMLLYQTFEVDVHLFREAHNDYLQLAAEGGILLGIPTVLCVVAFASAVRQRFRSQIEGRAYWLRVGAVMGLLAIALQETADFSLQIPGNAVLFCVLAAIALHHPARRRDMRTHRIQQPV